MQNIDLYHGKSKARHFETAGDKRKRMQEATIWKRHTPELVS